MLRALKASRFSKARKGKAHHHGPELLKDKRTVITGILALLLCWWALLHFEGVAPASPPAPSVQVPPGPLQAPDESERARLRELEELTKDWSGRATVTETENWDEEKGRCGDAAEECTLTFRFPPRPIWRRDQYYDGVRGVVDQPQPVTQERDSSFQCAHAHVDIKEDHWIVKGEGVIDTYPHPTIQGKVFDTVHHMDLFLCEKEFRYKVNVNIPDLCMENNFVNEDWPANRNHPHKTSISHPACIFATVWDKGALPAELPEGFGIKIGPSVVYGKELMIQSHFLPPKDYFTNPAYRPVWDRSGYKITLRRVDRSSPMEPLASISFNDQPLTYPKGQPLIKHSYDVPGPTLLYHMQADFDEFGAIQPVMAHLHAHGFTKKIWIDHLDEEGKKLGEYGRIDAYGGHGKDQTYLLLPKQDRERPMLPGHSLRIHCHVNTTEAPHVILYGVNHNTEMCAMLILYRNHNPLALGNFKHSNTIAICSRNTTECEGPPAPGMSNW